MGIPKFFAYTCERYPCVLQPFVENQVPEFDYLYLDMNGIFHMCSHPDDNDINVNLSEEDIYSGIFHYIDILVYLIKPKKLLFLAVDGVAPRAKMNQQRGRRYMSAKNAEMQKKKLLADGLELPKTPRFDPNCISPGTEFMCNLHDHLQYYVSNRISTDMLWQNFTVILSGHQVPGEGEHKIMDYIRYSKTLPDYDKFGRHCIYGSDADLMMLALCAHVQNISVLREEVKYGKNNRITNPDLTKFFLIQIPILREYLDLEFQDLKGTLPFEYNLTNIIDDWVLMGLIVGNDFIPNLPDFHIKKGAFPLLYNAYKEVLPNLNGYLNENGNLNILRFQTFMESLSKYDLENFEETYANLSFLEEKMSRTYNSEKNVEGKAAKDPELERLIKCTNDSLNFSDGSVDEDSVEMECDDAEEDTFLKEFLQHKRHYYTDKLQYPEVTDEVLKSEAEAYIRALQWILFYYYKGCPSWSWYYPHHYSPFTSDIVNFKDANLNFELGQPFLPFQQLLAILPPQSKNLMPGVYHELMTSPDSPIKNYFPEDFETDLNGKQQDWEAVVLLPFIQEDELLMAMESFNSMLTSKEKIRNSHGPFHIFSFTKEDLGTYRAPSSFPSITSNHAKMVNKSVEEIRFDKSELKYGEALHLDTDLFFPGFPSFRHVSFEISKKKGSVKPFSYFSRNESVILNILSGEMPDVQKLAAELIGKQIYVDWPFLREARVVALADANFKYSDEGEDKKAEDRGKVNLSREEKLDWERSVPSVTYHYMEKRGIDIGETEVLVYVNELEGYKQTFDSTPEPSLSKMWSESTVAYPIQVTVNEINTYEPHLIQFKQTEEMFPVDSVVFTLEYPYYGCMGHVRESKDQTQNARLPISVEIPVEPKIHKNMFNDYRTTFYSATGAAQRLGISKYLLSIIAETILIDMSNPEQMFESRPIVNIGLQLKQGKKNLEVPGYTKREGTYWTYSGKALSVMTEYMSKYPKVMEFLSNRTWNGCLFSKNDVFPGENGADEVKDIYNWIKSLECRKIEKIQCGSQVLEKEVVNEMEKIIDASPKDKSSKTIHSKRSLLFKSDLITRGLPPVASAEHQLFDRVTSVHPSHSIPIGLRGYIIGIYKAQSEADYMYDILYDEPFPGGMTLNCSPGRGYKVSRTSFINISHGERLRQWSKPMRAIPAEHPRSANSQPVMLSKERPSSAFAQWNQCPPTPTYDDRAEQLKSLWNCLEKVKSQNETKVLKKLLKIDEGEKCNIEDNVKTFFENISKNTENMSKSAISCVDSAKPAVQSERRYHVQLSNYFQARNLSQPRFHLMEGGDKTVGRVIFPDGRVFTGFPCRDKESARDSAALQALVGLGEVQLINEYAVQKENENSRRIKEHQEKLLRGLIVGAENDGKNFESAKPAANAKPKQGSDKLNRSNRPQTQNHRRYNVPQALPTPPLQWCRQYRTSSNMYVDQYKNSYQSMNADGKSRQDATGRVDHPGTGRLPNENSPHPGIHPAETQGRSRPDPSYGPPTGRNHGWRYEEKQRNQAGEQRSGNEHHRANNWRLKGNQGDSVHAVRLRPDGFPVPGNNSNQEKNGTSPNRVGTQGNRQRQSTIATEFIPLQALTRNRSRRNNRSNPAPKASKEQSRKQSPEMSPVKVTPPHREDKISPSMKPQRKSKIAAKFDTEWDHKR